MKKSSRAGGVNIDGILIDFDGVISPKAVNHIIDFVYDYLNQHTPIEYNFIQSFIKNIACFPPEKTIPLLLGSFGLESLIDDFFNKFHHFDRDGNNFTVDPDFAGFIEFCRKNEIPFKIFSLASPERLNVMGEIGKNNMYSLNGCSKANLKTFNDAASAMSINLKKWMYIDDNPVALRTGKLAGLKTIMMINDIYTESDFGYFRKFIDHKVSSFSEFKAFLSEYLV